MIEVMVNKHFALMSFHGDIVSVFPIILYLNIHHGHIATLATPLDPPLHIYTILNWFYLHEKNASLGGSIVNQSIFGRMTLVS